VKGTLVSFQQTNRNKGLKECGFIVTVEEGIEVEVVG
jgi:hypothetical protein